MPIILNISSVWTGVVIPIVTSILGGLIGGLFTFLGVKLTIKNDNKLKALELVEKVKERNREIIACAPQLKVVENDDSVDKTTEIYLLPYNNPKLISEDEIRFDYGKEIQEESFWDFYDVTIENVGKTEIEMIYLQLNYKSRMNLYTKYEIFGQGIWAIKYYSDGFSPSLRLKPDTKFKLRVYYPAIFPQIKDRPINAYLEDVYGNCWFQYHINYAEEDRVQIVSPDELTLHYRDGYYEWFVYDSMYYSKKIPKNFDTRGMSKLLQKRKEECWAKARKFETFRHDVTNGKVALRE